MSERSVSDIKPFSLETDDRSDEERAQKKAKKKGNPFALGSTEKTPMDTRYQEDLLNTKRKVKYNLNFDRKIRGSEGDEDEENVKKFDINTLFTAALSGDVTQLSGLHEYLCHSRKFLTNTEYKSKGRNALFKALLHLKDGKNETIDFLIDIAEKMGDLKEFVNASYIDSYYEGQSPLHVAIERRNETYVKLLVQKGADVHARACGKFFQQHNGPCFYFGELPLSLAACTNQQAIVDFLINNPYQKVDVTKADSQGNTVLHALVVVADNSKENTEFVIRMYDHILIMAAKLYPDTKLEEIENNRGLTPLKLAAKTGKIGLFKHMVQREFKNKEFQHLSRKFTEWIYGPVHSSLYDLTSVDSYEKNSVTEIIVYGSNIPNRLELLQVEPLNRLLEDKWKRFAQWIFLINLIFYIIYLSIFTNVAYNRKNGKPPFPVEHSREGYVYVVNQVLCVIAAVYFFIRGILDLKRKCPKLQTLVVDGYSEILFFIQAILFLISMGLYFCGQEAYLGPLVICLALSWVNLLYFSRGFRLMGIYSVMIQKMILGDVLRFILVYIVYLFGFSAAVVTLIEEVPSNMTDSNQTENNCDCKKPTYNNLNFTTLELFKFTIGMGDLEFTEQFQYKEIFYLLLISYIILTYILLLNMLIALMNKTVEKLSEESLNVWKLQRAITILDLERSLPSCLRKRLRSGVKKELGGGPGADKRWCLSMEEVNWNRWSRDLGIINEEPGCQVMATSPPAQYRRDRGLSWQRLLSRRHHVQVEEPHEHELQPITSQL